MKKMLILAGVIVLTMSTQCFADEVAPHASPMPQKQVCYCPPPKMHKPPIDKAKFEARLKLTDAQKEQARQLREKGHQEMKPIMDKIGEKRQELNTIKLSKIAPQAQEEKMAQVRKELRDLRRQAHELRMKNMKDFEAILTKKQLKELQKMKAEGRKEFEKNHKQPHGVVPEFGFTKPCPCQKAPVENK